VQRVTWSSLLAWYASFNPRDENVSNAYRAR
jgi:hypothetical protein